MQSRSIALSFVGNALIPLVGLLSAPLIAQSLGVQGRGDLAAASTPLLLLTSALGFGLPEATTFFVARSRRMRRPTLLWSCSILFIVGIAGSAALIPISGLLAANNLEHRTLIVFAGLALAPSLILLGVRGFAAGLQRWDLVTFERAAGALARACFVFGAFCFHELTLNLAIVSVAWLPLAGIIAYAPLLRSRLGSAVAARDLRASEVLRYGLSVWVGSFAGIVLSRIDQVLMIPLTSSRELGLYAVAVTLSEVALVFNVAVREVVFASESRGSASRSLRDLQLAARLSTTMTAVAALVLLALFFLFVGNVFGEGFEDCLPALAILTVAVVLGNPGSVAGSGLSGRGLPALRSLSLICAAIVNVVLLLLLAPEIGSVGAALATLAGNLVAASMNLFWVQRRLGASPLFFLAVRREDLSVLVAALRSKGSGLGT